MSRMGMNLAFLCGMTTFTLMYSLRHYLGYIFTSDEQVNDVVAEAMYVVGAYQVLDSMNGICGGIFRGCGHQDYGAGICAVAYYMVGIPAAYLIGFRADMQLPGLWLGITCGMLVASIAAATVVYRLDFYKEAQLAKERTREKVVSPTGSKFSSSAGEIADLDLTYDSDAKATAPLLSGGSNSATYGTV